MGELLSQFAADPSQCAHNRGSARGSWAGLRAALHPRVVLGGFVDAECNRPGEERKCLSSAAADGSSAQRTAEPGWAQQHPPAPGGVWKQQVGGFVLMQLLRFGEAGKGGLRSLKLGARSRRILSPLELSSPKSVLASKRPARLLWLSK